MKGGFFIDSSVSEIIKINMPKIFNKYPDLFSLKDSFNNYLDKKAYLKEQNDIIIKEISPLLVKKFGNKYNEEELFYMQKLYLLYPENLENDILKLPWNFIKIVLDLFNEEKRQFYIDNCLKYNWSLEELKEYIRQDVYEKYKYIQKKSKDRTFSMEKFLNLTSFIWNE